MKNLLILGFSAIALAGCATPPPANNSFHNAGNAYAADIVLKRCPNHIRIIPGKEQEFAQSLRLGTSVLGANFRRTNPILKDMDNMLKRSYACPAVASGINANAALSVFLAPR